MIPLKIEDIQVWLSDNNKEFLKLREEKFPNYNHHLFSIFPKLSKIIEYYSLKDVCTNAIFELNKILLNINSQELGIWLNKYNYLGSEQLLLFYVDYIEWNLPIDSYFIKITDDIYTESSPFIEIIKFCHAFQILYWENEVDKRELEKDELLQIKAELINIFSKIDIY